MISTLKKDQNSQQTDKIREKTFLNEFGSYKLVAQLLQVPLVGYLERKLEVERQLGEFQLLAFCFQLHATCESSARAQL